MIKRDKTQDITHNLNQDTQYSSMHVNGRCVLMTRCSSIPGKESWKEIHCPSFHAHPSTSLSSDKNTRDRTATRERNKLLVTIWDSEKQPASLDKIVVFTHSTNSNKQNLPPRRSNPTIVHINEKRNVKEKVWRVKQYLLPRRSNTTIIHIKEKECKKTSWAITPDFRWSSRQREKNQQTASFFSS